MENIKVLLRDDEIPREWYNILADMPTPMHPPLHPGTRETHHRAGHGSHLCPMNLNRAGDERGAVSSGIPDEGPGEVPPLASHTALPGEEFRKIAEGPGEDLLQGTRV